MPSFASSEWKSFCESGAAHAKASARPICGTRATSSFEAASAAGPPRTSLARNSATAASRPSRGTARLTRPTAAARAAGTRSPVRKSSLASARRSFGRHTTEITAGHTPRRTSVKPISASSATTEMSHAAASPTPPPEQWPAMRPTTGFGESMIASRMSTSVWRGGAADFVLRSAPAQKVLPAFVSTTARTASSSWAACSRSPTASTSSTESAFLLSGRFSVIVATPPSTAYSAASLITPSGGGGGRPPAERPSGTSTRRRTAVRRRARRASMFARKREAEWREL